MNRERKILLNVVILVIALGIAGVAGAGDMGTAFTYQGRLVDANSPAEGLYDFEFAVYDAIEGGSQQGSTVDVNDLDVIDGYFTVPLDFGSSVFTGDARWLEIGVRSGTSGGYTALSPRQEITPVPYALRTRGIFMDNSGNIGIGTTTPISKLDVAGDIHSSGSIASGNSITIDGITDKITASSGKIDFDDEDLVTMGRVGIGVSVIDPEDMLVVVAAGSDEIAVIGEATHTTGNTVGVEGVVYSPNGIAGSFVNESGAGRVLICHSGTEPYDHAFSVDSDGDIWVEGDVYARGSGTSTFQGNLGVNGTADVLGDLNVGGTLYKAAGSFKIDHPLDPTNKYLSHSFVESPDMMNVYNGNVELDKNGGALIKLPEYFEALNVDFRYQLTCIGGFAPVYIAEEISNNHFKIAGGKPGLEVSWQVTGIRKDAYAVANRIKVEDDKPLEARGSYLHPEAYGLPKEKGIETAFSPQPFQAGKGAKKVGES